MFTLVATPVYGAQNSDTARDQAKRILQDKKYGQDSDPPLNEQAKRLTRWLGEGESEIKERSDDEIRQESQPKKPAEVSPPSLGGLSLIGQVFLWVLVALTIGLIGFLVYKFFSSRNKKSSEKEDEHELPADIEWNDEEKILETITDAKLLENLSEKAENEGHFDLALRYRFRAGLLRLNELEIISFNPSVTNGQWQLLIDKDSFNIITRDFNDITYGHRPCSAEHLDRARASWSTLTNQNSSQKAAS